MNSFYKPLLHVSKQRQNLFMFPMESVSMCSELPYYLETERLFSFHTSSTNKEHASQVNKAFENGLFNQF